MYGLQNLFDVLVSDQGMVSRGGLLHEKVEDVHQKM